jgi:hypothetical protein
MFWCISFRLGAFVTVSLLHETWCKLLQTGAINVKVRAPKLCHNFSQRTLNSCFGAFLSVRVHLGPFRYCKKTRHTGAINAKVLATMSCQNFSQDAADPYHWTLISCFGAFLSVWEHLGPFRYCTKTRQTGAINAKVRAVMSC